jgi:molybdate transport repressor ModE-like protein
MLDELRLFSLVAEHGTFRAAARLAHLSQPAFSSAIARLEQRVGARLFERGPGKRPDARGAGGTTLTEAGRTLLPHARAALAAVRDGERAVREVLALEAGEARLGGGATACTYLLPSVLTTFRRRHPGVKLVLREDGAAPLVAAVRAGELDLVLVAPRRLSDLGELEHDRFVRDELLLVGPPGGPSKIDGRPFVTLPVGSSTRAVLEARFRDAPIAVEVGSLAAVKASVRAGAGVALVSRIAVARDLEQGRLVRLTHPGLPVPRTWRLAHRGVPRLGPAAAELRELLLACV